LGSIEFGFQTHESFRTKRRSSRGSKPEAEDLAATEVVGSVVGSAVGSATEVEAMEAAKDSGSVVATVAAEG